MLQRADPAGPEFAEAARLFVALGDPIRLAIVARLSRDGPLSITRLSAGTPVTRQAVTKHLRALGDAGLLSSRREGREHVWQIEPSAIEVARRFLGRVSAQWDGAIARLASFVED